MDRQSRERKLKRTRLVAACVSLAAHLALPFVLIRAQPPHTPVAEFEPIEVTLVEPLPPPPPPPPPPEPRDTPAPAPAPAKTSTPAPAPAKARPRLKVRPALNPPPTVKPLLAATAPKTEPLPTVGDAELAGALTADAGGAGLGGAGGDGQGGGCNMVRRLQAALRRDADIQAAVARARSQPGVGRRAILVWNGDWIRSPDQEGKGLAGVRQAIAMEVAFAPEACRGQTMRGLVVLALNDAPGGARLALGGGAWRWTDLLRAR